MISRYRQLLKPYVITNLGCVIGIDDCTVLFWDKVLTASRKEAMKLVPMAKPTFMPTLINN